MNKKFGIFFPRRNGEYAGYYKLRDMNTHLTDFFIKIADSTDDGKYISQLHQEKMIERFKITRATYFNRLGKLVEKGLLNKLGRGLYKINTDYVRVYVERDIELGKAIKNFKHEI